MSLALAAPLRSVSHRLFRRGASAAVAAAVAGSVMCLAPAAPAYADTGSIEAQFVAATNAARQSAGLAPYAVASDLASIARNWSAHMAAAGAISHNPNLTTQVQNWRAVGENVGVGPDEPSIQQAFMNSAPHRANILDHDYTQFGVGVVVSGGRVWVTVDFRQPMSAPAPAPAPARPAPAPVAAPRTTVTSTVSSAPRPTSPQPAATGTSSKPPAPAVHPTPTAAQLAAHRLWTRLATLREHARATWSDDDPVTRALQFAQAMSTLTSS